jgi:uncharacterized damage-inducible protein DinB
MMRFDSLIDAVQQSLEQEIELLSILTPEQYSAPAAGYYRSSVGMHLRHNLDHFAAFFEGLPSTCIDYESRERNASIEEQPEFARAEINRFLALLDALRSEEADFVIKVREESEAGVGKQDWLPSSLGRELQFLLGHTVHHNALIAMIVHGNGFKLPTGFGVAPSTQRHQQKLAPSSN